MEWNEIRKRATERMKERGCEQKKKEQDIRCEAKITEKEKHTNTAINTNIAKMRIYDGNP